MFVTKEDTPLIKILLKLTWRQKLFIYLVKFHYFNSKDRAFFLIKNWAPFFNNLKMVSFISCLQYRYNAFNLFFIKFCNFFILPRFFFNITLYSFNFFYFLTFDFIYLFYLYKQRSLYGTNKKMLLLFFLFSFLRKKSSRYFYIFFSKNSYLFYFNFLIRYLFRNFLFKKYYSYFVLYSQQWSKLNFLNIILSQSKIGNWYLAILLPFYFYFYFKKTPSLIFLKNYSKYFLEHFNFLFLGIKFESFFEPLDFFDSVDFCYFFIREYFVDVYKIPVIPFYNLYYIVNFGHSFGSFFFYFLGLLTKNGSKQHAFKLALLICLKLSKNRWFDTHSFTFFSDILEIIQPLFRILKYKFGSKFLVIGHRKTWLRSFGYNVILHSARTRVERTLVLRIFSEIIDISNFTGTALKAKVDMLKLFLTNKHISFAPKQKIGNKKKGVHYSFIL